MPSNIPLASAAILRTRASSRRSESNVTNTAIMGSPSGQTVATAGADAVRSARSSPTAAIAWSSSRAHGITLKRRATGVDVGAQELRDVFGRPVRRVALERLEGHLVEALHLGGEVLAGGLTGRREAAPDVEGVLEPARVPPDLGRLPCDVIAHRAVPAGGDPDPEPAVAEPRGAADRGIRSSSDDERYRRRRRRQDQGVVEGEELAVEGDRRAVGQASQDREGTRPFGVHASSGRPRRSRSRGGPRRRARRRA